MYCMTCVHKFLSQSDTIYEKCIILRLEIVVFSIMGECNLNGQHRWFDQDLQLPSSNGHVERIKMLLHNIHRYVCTRQYGVLTQTTIWILTTVSTSNPVPKIIMNWKFYGNVTLGKLNYRRAVHIFTLVFNITYFLIAQSSVDPWLQWWCLIHGCQRIAMDYLYPVWGYVCGCNVCMAWSCK